MSNNNKTYHKGKYRSREWAKHLRPYLKRLGNKKWRKTGQDLDLDEHQPLHSVNRSGISKSIEVLITKEYFGEIKVTRTSKYRTLRDAENAMNQAHVIRAEIIRQK